MKNDGIILLVQNLHIFHAWLFISFITALSRVVHESVLQRIPIVLPIK